MTKGIKEKDIRDFEKYAGKLRDVMARICEYHPEAAIYATPQTLHLMAGFLPHGASSQEEQEQVVASVRVDRLESGDW